MKDFLEKRKAAKAVDDPNIRKGDPACWSCLTDEQRDTICEWYCDMQLYDLEKQEKKDNAVSVSSYFALIPIAVGTAYHSAGSFLGSFIAAWVIDSIVFTLFNESYKHFVEWKLDGSAGRIAKVATFIGFAAVGAFVSWEFLNLVYR